MFLSRLFVFFFSCVFSLSFLSAQTKISGNVVDGADNAKLANATIALLNPVDSILIKFSWTNENGFFSINGLDTGRYKLIISYPKFAGYSKDIIVNRENLNLGVVKLSKATLLLEEVTVTGRVPIVINGDTTIYNASSFKVGKDANVEDLLKVLPGITVDANGNITAQGKEVKKVLLDGEEFFGNDHKLITKNIRSNMVDKVKVYEKKSDLAERTGVDDGERIQTIDITLKEDMKKGMFGQALAGVGTEGYYTGKAMINKFKSSEKIAVFGIGANDGMVSLGFEDGEKYGLSNSTTTISDGGGIFISTDDDDFSWDGSYSGNGVPRAFNLGASYSNKFNKDKHKINLNYQRRKLNVINNSSIFSQNNLPDIARIENVAGYTDDESVNNNANLRYDYKLDSLSDLTVRFGYRINEADNISKNNTVEQNLDHSIINELIVNEVKSGTNKKVNANFFFTRRFLKERRSLTLSSSFASSDNHAKSNFYALTNFTDGSVGLEVDQLKNDVIENSEFSAALNFTEPFSKRLTGSIGYTLGKYNSSTLNQSFDKDLFSDRYSVLDQSQLNDFEYTNFSNTLNAGINYKSSRLTLNISNRFGFEKEERLYNNINDNLNRNVGSIAPSLSVDYNLSKNKRINFRYNGRTTQPSLSQIEPLNQNRDARIQYLSNPNLNAGYSNSYNLYFNSYKPLKDRSIYAGTYFSQSFNTVISKMNYLPSTGQREIQFVNVDKPTLSGSFWGAYSAPVWKAFNLSLNFGANANYMNSYNYLAVNGYDSELNNNQSYSISPNIGLNSYKAEKWSFYLNLGPGVSYIKSSIQKDFDSKVFTLNSYLRFNYTLPKDFKIGMEGQQEYEGATKTIESFRVLNLNGFVAKKFLKDKSLEAQIMVNDIFDKNNGVRRSQSGYSFTQTTNDILRRFAMFKLIYNFTTMKGGE